jgi:hypothetical protein
VGVYGSCDIKAGHHIYISQSGRHWSMTKKKSIDTCRMDLPGPTTSVGTRIDYSVGPWDYPTCAARYQLA